MRFFKLQNLTLPFIVFLLISCSSGNDPSISIQPSNDVFDQQAIERNSSMDILWVIDNSGSMRSFQDQLRANFTSFIEDFISKNLSDFQIGVTVSDGFRDFRNNVFTNFSTTSSDFSSNDLPCTEGQLSNCFDYANDNGPNSRFQSTGFSRLKSTTCDVCYSNPNDTNTIGQGRQISVLSDVLLAELIAVCNIVNNDTNPSNNCEDTDEPNVTVSGADKFLDLFDQIMLETGTGGSGDERVFQSLQAARLNPENSELFREDTHLAVIIVSDEDDTSVEDTSDRCDGYRQDDEYGALHCPNAFNPGYYKNFLELASNDVLGVTVHNMGINPKGNGYSRPMFLENNFLNVFNTESSTAEQIAARDNYISGMANTYSDNEVLPLSSFQFRRPNDNDPFDSWVNNEAERKECRNIQIPLATNIFARFFSRRHTELAESTGGVVASLCADFSTSLSNIAQVIFERTSEFFLGDQVPSASTLANNELFVAIRNPGEPEFRVIQRDTSGINGWNYNPANNSIIFFGDAIPVNGAAISVIFDRETL